MIFIVSLFSLPASAGEAMICDVFSDKNLAQTIAESLGKEISDTVSDDELAQITVIGSDEQPVEVTSLAGVERLGGLTELYVTGKQIVTAEEIADLTNLETLSICDASLTQIPPVENLVNLSKLILNNNKLKKIERVEHLPNLEWLKLDNNLISDVTPAFQIEKLSLLDLNGNLINSLDFLYSEEARNSSIFMLDLNNNQISSVRPLLLFSCNNRPSISIYNQVVVSNYILDPGDNDKIRAFNTCVEDWYLQSMKILHGVYDKTSDQYFIDLSIPDEESGVATYKCEWHTGSITPFVASYTATVKQRWIRGFSKYDVNDDGKATVSDILSMKRLIFFNNSSDLKHDIDDNGSITVSDILKLKDYIMFELDEVLQKLQ